MAGCAATTSALDVKPHIRLEIEDACALFDKEQNGFIQVQHLKAVMRALGFEPRKQEMNKMLKDHKLDALDGTDLVSCAQVVCLLGARVSHKDSQSEIEHAFTLFDDDHTGFITINNLRKVANELAEHIPDEQLKEMLEEADTSGTGVVSQQDFVRIMKKTCLY